MKKRKIHIILFIVMLFFVTGCSVEKTNPNKIRDLKFVLVEEEMMPEELAALIEEKKVTECKMTFDTKDARYIIVGYGEQETGGYSISVEELYETENTVYISTNLIGPSKGEEVPLAKSYPYVVVRIEYTDKSVVFE